MKIKLIKYDKNVTVPTRAHYNDAGLDCHATAPFEIGKYQILTVPLGFGLEIPDGYMATIRPRSSLNKRGLITQIGTIDSGYRGEIKAVFVNPTDDVFNFKSGDKICQIIIEPVILAELTETLDNNRGEGGFGSAGR